MSDNGAGVDEAILADIFQPYVSSKSSSSGNKTVGLGLAIVKRIIEEHAGIIEMTNQTMGGARVRIWLPLDDVSNI